MFAQSWVNKSIICSAGQNNFPFVEQKPKNALILSLITSVFNLEENYREKMIYSCFILAWKKSQNFGIYPLIFLPEVAPLSWKITFLWCQYNI